MGPAIRRIGNEEELDRILNKEFKSVIRSTGYVEVGEDNFCLPAMYEDYEEKIRKFQVRDEDIYIVAPPKTGTTWCQEMVWLIANNLDYEKAEEDLVVRFPLLETPVYMDCNVVQSELWYGCHPWEFIEKLPNPRCLKTHLHWPLLPEQIKNGSKSLKIITTIRSPHDNFVSYYHHCRLMEGYKGTLEDLAKLFLAGRNPYGPYWKAVLSVWEQRHRPNVLILKFKEMKDDLPGVIRRVANFLEKPLVEEQVQRLAKHLSFDDMKKNPAVNQQGLVNLYAKKYGLNIVESEFIRSGKVGGYKKELSPELIERFDQWEKEKFGGTGLSFE